MKIFKYELEVEDIQSINMPWGATILTAQVQNGAICLWAEVAPYHDDQHRTIRIVGTGHELPDEEKRAYIGTIQLHGGSLVFHVYEVLN